MLIIATYVVSTETSQGRRRQHGVAKVCERVGQGLQKSVYNHQINQMQYEALERALLAVMDLDEDNLRLHRLANRTIRASSNKVSSAPSAPSATSRRPRQTKARAKTRQVRAAPKLISDVLERSPDARWSRNLAPATWSAQAPLVLLRNQPIMAAKHHPAGSLGVD
jgi:CRISPR-associated protein Cas2